MHNWKLKSAFACCACLLLIFVVGCFAGEPVPAPSAMAPEGLRVELEREEEKINARREQIQKELCAPDRDATNEPVWAREWAGSYYEGDGLGTNVRIDLAPTAGIAYTNHGCLGLYGGDHGRIVEALADGLRLELVFGSAKGSFLSERVFFVKWDEDRFLVPDWLMPRFINNYNEGGYAREAMYGIPCKVKPGVDPHARFSGPTKRKGRPEVPQEFAALLGRRIELRVAAVQRTKVTEHAAGGVVHRTAMEFASGISDGVYVGMEFAHPRGSGPKGTLRITAVSATGSSGEFTFWGDENSPFVPAVREGDLLIASEGEADERGRTDGKREP